MWIMFRLQTADAYAAAREGDGVLDLPILGEYPTREAAAHAALMYLADNHASPDWCLGITDGTLDALWIGDAATLCEPWAQAALLAEAARV